MAVTPTCPVRYDPLDEATLTDPYPVLAALRAHAPLDAVTDENYTWLCPPKAGEDASGRGFRPRSTGSRLATPTPRQRPPTGEDPNGPSLLLAR
ncbi:hypothetical protein ACWGIA_21655 [Streptomyces bobili]